MVYVDCLRKVRPSVSWPYTTACHLIADTGDELAEFAIKIGLKLKWFQNHPKHPHFDLTARMRKKAIVAGAIGKVK